MSNEDRIFIRRKESGSKLILINRTKSHEKLPTLDLKNKKPPGSPPIQSPRDILNKKKSDELKRKISTDDLYSPRIK
jgi:hypothetical protein